jgi:hypothetical protein
MQNQFLKDVEVDKVDSEVDGVGSLYIYHELCSCHGMSWWM